EVNLVARRNGKVYNWETATYGIGYSLKDKNEAKTDKTKHGIGKSVKSQSQSERSKPKTYAS
ncbi:hypothetical protein Tco_0752888, partial [Tanacetum coccineum]